MAGPAFTCELLELIKQMHGESAPERLLYQYFQGFKSKQADLLQKLPTLEKRVAALLALREAEGCIWRIDEVSACFVRIVEYHNPLRAVFANYPRVIQMEQAALGELVAARCSRRELPSLKGEQARVVFEFELSGTAS